MNAVLTADRVNSTTSGDLAWEVEEMEEMENVERGSDCVVAQEPLQQVNQKLGLYAGETGVAGERCGGLVRTKEVANRQECEDTEAMAQWRSISQEGEGERKDGKMSWRSGESKRPRSVRTKNVEKTCQPPQVG